MFIAKYRVYTKNGYDEALTKAELLERHPGSAPKYIEEDIPDTEPNLLQERKDALAVAWPDAFDLLDDILDNGIADVKLRRDAIKTNYPKPID